MAMTVRTRFAPSPTGFLHIGSVRTALFAWAFARRHKGQFILRIEDTDQIRSTQESVDAILQGMGYLNLDYDEGPFYQSQRLDRYQATLSALLASGHAYYCYCTKDRLEKLRQEQQKNHQKPRYDGCCRPQTEKRVTQNEGVLPVVRFKNPQEGAVVWKDLVKGVITISNTELDDLVLARSDGMPTYNFCVVVDDLEMRISHVIRGDDHINNTPRQINILNALQAPLPDYAHLPMIFNAAGQKMSKRRDPVDILAYQTQGFLPEALLNYLARLGWGYEDREFFTMAEFCQWFDLANVQPSASRFDPEKLLWLNAEHIKATANSVLQEKLAPYLTFVADTPNLEMVIGLVKSRSHTLLELAQHCLYFYQHLKPLDREHQAYLTDESLLLLKTFTRLLENLPSWTPEAIHEAIATFCQAQKMPFGKLAMPLRLKVCGVSQTPSIDAVLAILGQVETLKRLKAVL